MVPEQIARTLRSQARACLGLETPLGVGFVIKAPRAEIDRLRGAPVKYAGELFPTDYGPVVRLVFTFLIEPRPLVMAARLNIADPHDHRLLRRLMVEDSFVLVFLDERLRYVFSQRLVHVPVMRDQFARLTEAAARYLLDCDVRALNWEMACADVALRFPLRSA